MISLNIKSEPKAASPLNLSAKKDEPKLSFSELLKGVSVNKETKVVQNGALVLSLAEKETQLKPSAKTTTNIPTKETLSSLLRGSEVVKSEENKAPIASKESVELNPKLMQNLSITELKTLISDAKEYLKEQVQQSEGYKKAQIKELPSTLKGLVEVAKKFNIDISKITVEQVQVKSTRPEVVKQEVPFMLLAKEVPTLKEAMRTEVPTLKEAMRTEVPTLKEAMRTEVPTPTLKEAMKAEVPTPTLKEAIKAEVPTLKEAMRTEVPTLKEAMKAEVPTPTLKEARKVEVPKNEMIFSTAKESVKTEELLPKKIEIKSKEPKHIEAIKIEEKNSEFIRVEDKKVEQPKQFVQPKETPLFKAQERTEHTTEQFVQTKQFKIEEKTPKQKADETLKLLLRGEKPSVTTPVLTPALTPDFSVATAKVLASTTPTEGDKSFEQLLRGTDNESLTNAKIDGLVVPKADSLEVKLNEAKQMIKYLSSDVKTAIEEYKSPFTRVKVQLNPQKLGEIDLTIVQRGKNLHVNISSNNVAINTLVMNANELKTQLNNNGILNATLNFNNNSQGDNSSAFGGQQQSRQQEQRAHEEYNYFGEEETNEEILSSLEIVVSHYA